MKRNAPMPPTLEKTTFVTLVLCGLLFASMPALATSGPREARGSVLDGAGNPVAGAVVEFTPMDSANKDPVVATTNKKGRFFVPNLFSSQGDDFAVSVKAEGFLPVQVRTESRTVNKVLLGAAETKTLKYGQSLPSVFIRPLGEGIVDITMAPEAEVLATAQVEAEAVAAKATAETAKAAPQRDPWAEALELAADGDLEDSVQFFEKAIEKSPQDAERRETFAKVLYQIDRHDEAVIQAHAAIELAPQSVGPRMVIYSAYVAQDRLDDAKGVLIEAHQIAPANINVLEQTAFVASRQGDQQAGIAAYEQIVEIDAAKTDAWVQLGDLYAKTGQSAKSETAYQKVGELDPSGAHSVFFNIGALIMNRNSRTDEETRKAIESFRKAIEIKADYAQAHKQLAFALLGVNDRPGAKAALLAYVQYAPSAPDAAQMKSLADGM